MVELLCSEEGECPFSFTDESEVVQGYGCLPTPYEIRNMRIHHGKTWACHVDVDKVCVGAIRWLKVKGLPYSVEDEDLVTEDEDWSKYIGVK